MRTQSFTTAVKLSKKCRFQELAHPAIRASLLQVNSSQLEEREELEEELSSTKEKSLLHTFQAKGGHIFQIQRFNRTHTSSKNVCEKCIVMIIVMAGAHTIKSCPSHSTSRHTSI